jgi:magnesium and cobalt exporter, CNNM family
MESLADSSIYLTVLIFSVSLVSCTLFAFLETTITALRLFKLKELAATNGHYQKLFQSLEKNQHRVLSTIIIANHLASFTAAVMSTRLMETFFAQFPSSIGFSLGIGLTTGLILVFGEIIPKNIAKIHGERMLGSMLWLVNSIYYVLYPFINILITFANYILYKISDGKALESTEFITSEKEIHFLIDYITEKGLIESEKTSMLKSVFALGTTPVRNIMVPTTSIVSINAALSMKETLSLFSTYHYSRFPVYEEHQDNIIGMLHMKDIFTLISRHEECTLKDIVRPILFMPESIKVNQLLKEFKQQQMHIAMVLNEYGGIVGLVTLEDVLEEIVGDIRDEHEDRTEKAILLKQGSWLVDATIELEQLNTLLNTSLETEASHTLGGFLTEKLMHVPKKGERVTYGSYNFQVQQANQKRVVQVLIFKQHNDQAEMI